MHDRVVIVTGANTGIGKETAIGLAKAGMTVVMACRDMSKSTSAVGEIRVRSGSDAVHLMQLDLGSHASIRAFVRAFAEKYDRLDVLMNNAGVASSKRRVTGDGFELHFGVNHLGSFLLTTLLLPVMERSAPSRVLIVVGSAQRGGKMKWDDLQIERNYSAARAAGQSRLANLLFMRGLITRVDGVTVNAIDPGVARTDIARDLSAPLRMLSRMVVRSPERAARTSIYLATSPEVDVVTGTYFKRQRVTRQNPLARDDVSAERLWQISEQLVAESANR